MSRSSRSSIIAVKYSPVNQAWSAVVADQMPIRINGQRFFERRADLVKSLEKAGLEVHEDGSIHLRRSET